MNVLYFISYGDPRKPKGKQAAGVIVTEAPIGFTIDQVVAQAAEFDGIDKEWVAYVYPIKRGGTEDKELPKNELVTTAQLTELNYKF